MMCIAFRLKFIVLVFITLMAGCAGADRSADLGPVSDAAIQLAAETLELPEPGRGMMSMAATLVPKSPKAGETVVLVVKAQLEEDWHTYPHTKQPGVPQKPTKLKLTLPEGWSAVTQWQWPQASEYEMNPDIDVLTGTMIFQRSIKVAEQINPSDTVQVTMACQVCNFSVCLPPQRLTASVEVE